MSNMPTSKTLPSLLEELVRIHGNREAVVDGERRLTYAELARAVETCARGLAALGARPGDKVAVLMGNRLEWIVSALAATSFGGVAVAVNTWSTAREIAHALKLSEARFLVCTPGYMKHDYVRDIETMRSEGQLPGLETIVGVGRDLPASWQRWESLAERSAQAQASIEPPGPDDTAFILFTSGSTSHPKGVELAHRSLIENTWAIGERMNTTERDRLWLAVSLFWGFGCSNALVNLLSHGGCIVLQESFDAGAALALMEAERCTLMYAMPNMVQALLDHPDYAKRDLSSLRSGATIGTPEQIRRAAKLAPAVCQVYGLTEVYGNCHVTNAGDALELRMRSAGKPLPGTRQHIVDPQTELEVGVGEVGELRVQGHVMKGYYKDPVQTAAAFDKHGFFRTGDLACIDADGNLFFRGRIKELVKTGGMNVSPAEVEAVLMSHPGVQLALVVGLPHPTRDEVLAAVIVPKAGHALAGDELKDFCRRNLAVYKVPAAFHFSTDDALPLTTTGKIQKNRIAATFFAAEAQK
jgi:fatty-acyl-CoA synthase